MMTTRRNHGQAAENSSKMCFHSRIELFTTSRAESAPAALPKIEEEEGTELRIVSGFVINKLYYNCTTNTPQYRVSQTVDIPSSTTDDDDEGMLHVIE